MALEFKKGLDAIKFGDITVVPKLDVEKRLRLQNIKLEDVAGIKEAVNVISSCFEGNEDEVKAFINEYMGLSDIARLQVYLVGGDSMLEQVDKKIQGVVDGE